METIKPPSNLEIRFINKEIGYGVFATELIKSGDIVETCYCLVFDDKIENFVDYTFNVNNGNKKSLLALGLGSIYNHNFDPNIKWIFKEDNVIQFIATRDININEEVCHNYGATYWSKRGRKMI